MNKQQEQQEAKYQKSIKTLENKIEQMIKTQLTTKDNIENKYSKIVSKLEESIKNIEQDKENLNSQVLEQKSTIAKLEEEFENFKTPSLSDIQNNCQPFIAKLDKSSPGILQRLKNIEKSPFDHLFVVSQSSNDIYSIIDPNTNDKFCILDIGKYIDIELKETITITGVKLFTSSFCFPKSFDMGKIKNVNMKLLMQFHKC